MKIGITGASGFVGMKLIENLAADQNFVIVENTRKNEVKSRKLDNRIRKVVGDLNSPHVSFNFTEGLNYVIHSAARLPTVNKSDDHFHQLFEDNVLASIALGQAAIKNKVQNFIYISSANVYSKGLSGATEADPVGDHSSHEPYFLSKLAGEQALLSLFAETDTKLTILRIGSPFGEGERGQHVLSRFIDRARLGDAIEITSDPNFHMNCLSIDDVISAIRLCLVNDSQGIFNISSDNDSLTLLEIAQYISRHYENKSEVIHSRKMQLTPSRDFSWVSIEKAKTILGFSPMEFKDFLNKYINYYEMKIK